MTRVCENQLCNAGDEGEPKEIVPKQYANGKWSKQRFCCSGCGIVWRTYCEVTEVGRLLSEDEIRDETLAFMDTFFGFKEMTPYTIYAVMARVEWSKLDAKFSRGNDNPLHKANKRLMTLSRRFIPELRENTTSVVSRGESRWGFLLLCEWLFPNEYRAFCDTYFWCLALPIRREGQRRLGVTLEGNMEALDFIFTYAVQVWEEKEGREMTMDDVHGMWRYPQFFRVDGPNGILENKIFQFFDLNDSISYSRGYNNHSRELFVNTKNRAMHKRMANRAFYTPDTMDRFLLHMEQKVRFPNTMISDSLRDNKGRFVKKEFDFFNLLWQPQGMSTGAVSKALDTSYIYHHPKWQNLDFKRRVFKRVVKDLRPSVSVGESFPYDLSNEDAHKVANLSTDEFREIIQWRTLCSRHKGFDTIVGVHTLLRELWPNYLMDELIWNHKSKLMELQIYTHLNEVIGILTNGEVSVKAQYRYPLNWSVGNMKKRKPWMTYSDTGRPIELDLYIPRFKVTNPESEYYGEWVDECVIEIQGPQHYGVVKWGGSSTRMKACKRIDETHPEYDLWEELHGTLVRHDRIKKRRLGKRMIYLPVCPEAEPVKGVHGDLGNYNYRFTSALNRKEGRHGLAELFEMQNRADLSGMIRWYATRVASV